MITIIAVGITIVLCTIAHEWDIKQYKKDTLYYKNSAKESLDRYYDLLDKTIKEKADQLSDTPDDYIMD